MRSRMASHIYYMQAHADITFQINYQLLPMKLKSWDIPLNDVTDHDSGYTAGHIWLIFPFHGAGCLQIYNHCWMS